MYYPNLKTKLQMNNPTTFLETHSPLNFLAHTKPIGIEDSVFYLNPQLSFYDAGLILSNLVFRDPNFLKLEEIIERILPDVKIKSLVFNFQKDKTNELSYLFFLNHIFFGDNLGFPLCSQPVAQQIQATYESLIDSLKIATVTKRMCLLSLNFNLGKKDQILDYYYTQAKDICKSYWSLNEEKTIESISLEQLAKHYVAILADKIFYNPIYRNILSGIAMVNGEALEVSQTFQYPALMTLFNWMPKLSCRGMQKLLQNLDNKYHLEVKDENADKIIFKQ